MGESATPLAQELFTYLGRQMGVTICNARLSGRELTLPEEGRGGLGPGRQAGSAMHRIE